MYVKFTQLSVELCCVCTSTVCYCSSVNEAAGDTEVIPRDVNEKSASQSEVADVAANSQVCCQLLVSAQLLQNTTYILETYKDCFLIF